MKSFMKFAGTVAFSLALCLTSRADNKKIIEKTEAREPKTDQEFLTHAIACEIAEVKTAELALKTSKNEDVRRFANRMITDHSKSRDALLERAKEIKLAVVEGVAKEQRERMEKLSKLEGSAFDREYMQCETEGHEIGLKMWEKWSLDAKEQNIRDLAKRSAAVVKEHLEMAREISKKLKG